MTLFVLSNKNITFSLFLWMLYLVPLEQHPQNIMVSLKHLFRNDNAISRIVLVLWVIFVPSNCILRFKSNLKITFCIAIDDRMLIWIRPDLFNKSISGNESNSNNLIYFLNRWWLAKVEYFRLTKVLLWWNLTKQSYPSILSCWKVLRLSYLIPSHR